MTCRASQSPGVPIGEAERISSIDVLRGVAVLGILGMNIRNFAMPIPAFDDPAFPDGFRFGNFIAWVVGNVFFEDKMIAIFSMLFGAGIVIFTERAEARSAPVATLYYLRHFWLLVFGVIHAYGFWYGDVLITYAVCGMLLFPLRRLSPAVLLVVGVLVYSVAILFRQWPDVWDPVAKFLFGKLHQRTNPPMSSAAAYHGAWVDLFRWRVWVNYYWNIEGAVAFNLWRCSGFMLAGMALLKLGVLEASRSARFYRNMMVWGYGIGLPLAGYGVHESMAESRVMAARFGSTSWTQYQSVAMLLASAAVALGHVGLVMQMCRARLWERFRNALAATGRMALTNYLGQTLICVLVFDGWALGQWGRWGIAPQLLVVVSIWIAQLIVSPIWLRHFRFGPMEWLWRSLTYWKRQPMRATGLLATMNTVLAMIVVGSTALLAQESRPDSRASTRGTYDLDAASKSVAYTLTPVAGPPAAVRVTLRVRGAPGGKSRLSAAPAWAYVENCERFVHGLTVRDDGGRPCRVEEDRDSPHGWIVHHGPGATITAEYELRPLAYDPLAGFQTHFEPVVRDDLLHLIGETGLVYPEWLEQVGSIPIELRWKGLEQRGWTAVSPFDAEGRTINLPPQAFRHAIFLAGRIRVHDRDIRGGKLRVALHGHQWEFEDPELVSLVERVMTLEREFVNDFGGPYFLVTCVPTGPRADQRSMSLGGNAMTNCFALYLPPGTNLAPESVHRIQLLRLLAHEYFHTWNGNTIALAPPNQLDATWFTEGLTEFYSARLLRRAGLIDDAEWLKGLNEVLKTHWLSPAATAPAETVRRDYWKAGVGGVPMHRGIAIGHILDEEIRSVSSGKRSVDDFFLDVLAASGNGQTWDNSSLLARVTKWTNADCAERIRRIVIDGALPDLPLRISEPRATRVESEETETRSLESAPSSRSLRFPQYRLEK